MKLSELKNILASLSALNFIKPDGTAVAAHFHVTEAGLVSRHFIDCGGTVRQEKNASFQLWVSDDTEHRLLPEKFMKILSMPGALFETEDLDVEVEYQSGTIGRYGLKFSDEKFLLVAKYTDCLAKDICGIPTEKKKIKLSELPVNASACCTPTGKCC